MTDTKSQLRNQKERSGLALPLKMHNTFIFVPGQVTLVQNHFVFFLLRGLLQLSKNRNSKHLVNFESKEE